MIKLYRAPLAKDGDCWADVYNPAAIDRERASVCYRLNELADWFGLQAGVRVITSKDLLAIEKALRVLGGELV